MGLFFIDMFVDVTKHVQQVCKESQTIQIDAFRPHLM